MSLDSPRDDRLESRSERIVARRRDGDVAPSVPGREHASDGEKSPASHQSMPETAGSAPSRAGKGGVEQVSAVRRGGWTLRETASFLISFILHLLLLIVLSFLVMSAKNADQMALVINPDPALGDSLSGENSVQLTSPMTSESEQSSTTPLLSPDLMPKISPDRVLEGPTVPSPESFAPSQESSPSQIVSKVGPKGGGLEGRRGDRKGQLLAEGPGTPESENAVSLALAWLAAHQWQDGGWRFDLLKGPCSGQCRDPGTIGTTTGATGLALLPFLGAGMTHTEGEYRDVVNNGLYYLKSRIVPTSNGADLQEGTMYAQGIATIALCEAYAMTQDESLRKPAQQAVDFICAAQHSAGGWRYIPNQPGDTTVFGWQMMALKSAMMAGLDVPSPVLNLAERYLDSVQAGGGAYYGYMVPTRSSSPTAIGLLIRMYTGWPHEDKRLKRGVEFLVKEGPSTTDVYFNYYSTQVMHHYGGPDWLEWNTKMRDYLVRTQVVTGHERGSWFFVDQHSVKAGRLYTTAMSAMILEVYYRHMPLYGNSVVDDGL